MSLKRKYNKGVLIKFKWYDNWTDSMFRPDNFRVVEGIVKSDCITWGLDVIYVYNQMENKTYGIRRDYIIKK